MVNQVGNDICQLVAHQLSQAGKRDLYLQPDAAAGENDRFKIGDFKKLETNQQIGICRAVVEPSERNL